MWHFNPACPCCLTIGFDDVILEEIVECVSDINPKKIGGLKHNITKIKKCRAVFAGVKFSCSTAIRFGRSTWPTIKQWIEKGGRFFLSTEYEGCLLDPNTVSDFLSSMGSSMAWLGGSVDVGCRYDRFCTPGAANIASGIIDFKLAATARIGGGTPVFIAPAGVTTIAVEQIGNGFLFLGGDSNYWSVCGYVGGNCEFVRRLLTWRNADII